MVYYTNEYDLQAKSYPNICTHDVSWTLRNKLQWNLNLNSNIFFQQNAFEDVQNGTICLSLNVFT